MAGTIRIVVSAGKPVRGVLRRVEELAEGGVDMPHDKRFIKAREQLTGEDGAVSQAGSTSLSYRCSE